MITQLLARSPGKASAARLYAAAAAQSRAQALYAHMDVPDTIQGRYEMLTLHVLLLIDRLKGASAEADDVRQRLFDAYVSNLDGALREMGVGDLAVPKRMRKLGEAFYGRAQGFDAAFAALPDRAPLSDLLTRTAFSENTGVDPTKLATYVASCRDALAKTELGAVLAGKPNWSRP